MALNKALLRKVARHILEEPRRYDQTTFVRDVPTDRSPCGTQACIAGWADHLANGRKLTEGMSQNAIRRRAKKALGLTEGEATRLFAAFPDDYIGENENGDPIYEWATPYAEQYRDADTKEERAEVAARYLRRIARTGKVT